MTQGPVIQSFFDEPTNTVSYLVADPATKEAAVIDPVLDYDAFVGRQLRCSSCSRCASFSR